MKLGEVLTEISNGAIKKSIGSAIPTLVRHYRKNGKRTGLRCRGSGRRLAFHVAETAGAEMLLQNRRKKEGDAGGSRRRAKPCREL